MENKLTKLSVIMLSKISREIFSFRKICSLKTVDVMCSLGEGCEEEISSDPSQGFCRSFRIGVARQVVKTKAGKQGYSVRE